MNKRSLHFVLGTVIVVACLSAAGLLAQQPASAPSPRPPVADQKPVPPATPVPAVSQPPATPPPAASQPVFASTREPAPWGPNVRVDVTITDQTGTNPPIKKVMSVTASRNSSIRSGVNVPVPSTTFGSSASAPSGVPVTSYNYRNMGLSLDLRDVEVRDNQIRLYMTVEYSPLDETEKPATAAATPVSYSNFSQSFWLVLDNGKPIVAAQTSDPVPSRDRKLSVELKATILK